MASTDLTVDERRKQIWKGFIGHHMQNYHGLRTRWNAKTCQVSESFKSQRHFYLGGNEEEAIMKNTHYYENKEPVVLGPWKLSLANITANGLVHPFSTSARGLFFQNGDCIWATKSLQEGQAFNEIFFCHGHLRSSLACAYLPAPELSRITLILEDSRGWGLVDKWAAMDFTLTSSTKVPDDWPSADLQLKGREKILTVDLEEKEGEVIIWKPPEVMAGYHAYSFPNGYLIVCPDTLMNGVEVEITAVEYTTEEGIPFIRQITACYDVQGQFTKVKEVIFQ